MSAKKAAQDIDIPVKVLKENAEFFADQICRQFNEAICSSKFPATSKFANVTPIISKIFEKLICRQLSQHFNKSVQNSSAIFDKALMHNTAFF